ncbi:MAG: DeoR/GlpR family DNA-binding transcription regulator [Anaerolineae bacterium]
MAISAQERRAAIVQELLKGQMVRVSDLSERFGVSEVSIRRDLSKLEEEGLLKRVHGGAASIDGAVGRTFQHKMLQRAAEKERIGQAAARLIASGESIILDSGTTPLYIARHIASGRVNVSNLTVITASRPVFQELALRRDIHLIILGGIYLPEYESLIGPLTVANLSRIHANKFFMGADGLSFQSGATTANLLEAEVTRAMIQAAEEVIVVADSSKIGFIGFTPVIPLESIDKLITDVEASAEFLEELRRKGVEVILA